jgi:hypothetical protein
MSTITEAEQIVLNLPLRERGEFAAKLLATLRPIEIDDEAIITEALRRSEELKSDPEIAISLNELDRRMQERFGWK